ncbi:PNP-UDP-1 domain-containing protein [Acetobacteraceae bacterium EV16G]|uniref:PNP-UDP-1 domain-containing protein n=1 Tax=Sorlinia euscelidii TaxID=3081148 RepID=A0ABU7U0I9_9PROT
MKLGILVGLKAEARLIRPVFPDALIAVSGATRQGAMRGVETLRRSGAAALLSFGCAGGLSAEARVGDILTPDWVLVDGQPITCDIDLLGTLGLDRRGASSGGLYHSDVAVTRAADKHRLWMETHCRAVDMESGVVALSGLRFCVLRVICDDAARDLPRAVESIMGNGGISFFRIMTSLIMSPGQIPDLMRLGGDARKARQSMADYLGTK